MKPHMIALGCLATILCLVLLAGCAVVKVVTPPAVQVAACAALQKHPEAAPYIAAAGDTFTIAGKATPPTPADLAALLKTIPGADINSVYADAAWQGSVLVYDELWSLAKTPQQKADLQSLLSGIGAALTSAVNECGPKTVVAYSGAASPAHVDAIAQAVEAQFRAHKH